MVSYFDTIDEIIASQTDTVILPVGPVGIPADVPREYR